MPTRLSFCLVTTILCPTPAGSAKALPPRLMAVLAGRRRQRLWGLRQLAAAATVQRR